LWKLTFDAKLFLHRHRSQWNGKPLYACAFLMICQYWFCSLCCCLLGPRFVSKVQCHVNVLVFERDIVIFVPCFKIMFCHSNVSPCITRHWCDHSLIYNITYETLPIERTKVFFLQLHFLWLVTSWLPRKIFWLRFFIKFAVLVVEL